MRAVAFFALARLAIVSLEVRSPQVVQIMETGRRLEVDIASVAPIASVRYLAAIVFS
jgi:hypothetical protein